MSDVTISYKGSSIATMDATGSKTLLTEGKYCEDDITVDYVKPSSGDTVYYGETGIVHIKDVVIPATVTSTQNCTFYMCQEIETITALGSTQGRASNGGYNCAKLKSVSFPCGTTFDGYFIRQGGSEYNKLESVTIGSIGHAVTSLANGTWRYGSHAMNLTVTIYVDATTIAGIPASVQNNANGNNAYAPSGSTVTVVYKNSTTGEVITS